MLERPHLAVRRALHQCKVKDTVMFAALTNSVLCSKEVFRCGFEFMSPRFWKHETELRQS